MPSLRPYPAYKDTSLPWLGQIPAHWEIKRLKWTIEYCQNGAWGEEPNGIDDVPCVRVADFDRTKFRVNFPVPTLRALPKSERRNKSLKKGDLLLEKSGGGDLQPVGFVVLYDSDEPAICSNFVARMPVRENYDPNFLCYLHTSLYASKINTQSIKQNTGIQNLDSVSYLNEKVALPPLPEQRTIAAYLDRQTAKIDALIAKKQRLLDLLAEQRAALITQAVTGKLPHPAFGAPLPAGEGTGVRAMKDSGVPWLGQVPSHWEVDLVKRHFDIDLGKMLDTSKQPENGFLKPYLRAANIYWEGVWIDDVNEMKFTKEQLKRYRLQKGDLLVTEGGVTVGRSAIYQGELEEVYYQNSINRARPKGTLPVKFLYYWLYALKLTGFIDNVVSKATFGHLTKDKLELLQMTVPPKQEAELIVEHLDAKLIYIARVEDKIKDAIARLREYRAALISSVVTGKVQVT